ncbi:MAG: tRNA (adenosine(37)-N6)-threonylcarbamoyltransferase complex transferase subunit TsaD [Phycisphaerales bacterium]|nr:MAG: tRNA (adenosine(37)-N6)-threonylcarbamoyltransferase complex transferase subunit TsaD [Phycisphaerales bacterium]
MGERPRLVLGLESSCDETAASVVEGARLVWSSVVATQAELHAEYGGVVPEIASRAHAERITPVVRAALDRAGVTLAEIDAVAVGHRPGLIGSLLVGVAAAKALAWALPGRDGGEGHLPLVGVDHVHAHLWAAALADGDGDDPGEIAYPAIGLVVSGGHTSTYRLDGPLTLSRLGRTIDDAVGEAYDKAATILGLEYPGGPNLDTLAVTGNECAHDFPVSRLGAGSLDFSFSGLKTAVLYAVRGTPRPKHEGGGYPRDLHEVSDRERADVAASFQRAASRAVVLKLERALAHLHEGGVRPRSLVAGGGVTANSRLRVELAALAERADLELRIPKMRYCVDNAAMIAGLGGAMLASGVRDDLTLTPVPTTAC